MGAEQRIGDNIRVAVAASEFAAAELENEIGSWTALLLVSSLKKKFHERRCSNHLVNSLHRSFRCLVGRLRHAGHA